MGRLFDEHLIRRVRVLDGTWTFCTDEQDAGEREKWFCRPLAGSRTVVPSVWNLTAGLLTFEGAAWYEKEFYTSAGCLRLVFGGVLTEAAVWFDGVHVADHYGGFSQFDVILPHVEEGMHRLTVRVDNRFDAHSIPQKKVDWYHYGGIIRPVYAEELHGITVLQNRLEYTLSPDLTEVRGRFVLDVFHAAEHEASDTVRAEVAGCETACRISLGGFERKTITLPEFTLRDVRLWDAGAPALYSVCIRTGTDDLFDRVGFRRIEVRNGQIFLNNHPVEFRGVNRHEEHPDFGFAVPVSLMIRDLDLALAAGCNAIRGSHYPNSKEFLDLCDERGVLFWSEIPIWGCGFSPEAIADPVILSRGLEMHREMVEQYYNHPSVVIWGMHNEIPSDCEAAVQMSREYYTFLKENGGERLVTYASHKPMSDLCLAYCDVISLNLYIGWYGGKPEDWNRVVQEFLARRKQLGLATKPVIFSEFGAAALYGCHDDESVLWSEEYQAALLAHCLTLFHEEPAVAGAFVWQFTDIRTCPLAGINRARGFNNKGILNEYRKPKLAYHAVKNRYLSFAKEKKS